MAGNAIDVSARHDLAKRSPPFLPPGSEIRQAFIAQTAPSSIFFIITYLTGLTMFWIKYRCVAVTSGAIYVLESTKLSGGAPPHSVVGATPRRTHLGPASGRWAQVILLGERHWVHERLKAQITAPDHEVGLTYDERP